jgi:hypothetical protein
LYSNVQQMQNLLQAATAIHMVLVGTATSLRVAHKYSH